MGIIHSFSNYFISFHYVPVLSLPTLQIWWMNYMKWPMKILCKLQIKKTSLVIVKIKKNLLLWLLSLTTTTGSKYGTFANFCRIIRGRNHRLNSKSAPKLAFRDHTQDYKLLMARKKHTFPTDLAQRLHWREYMEFLGGPWKKWDNRNSEVKWPRSIISLPMGAVPRPTPGPAGSCRGDGDTSYPTATIQALPRQPDKPARQGLSLLPPKAPAQRAACAAAYLLWVLESGQQGDCC